ncbi:MAG: 23S rRNA pseudouridine(1911/1915/1917) synthase RluD [Steroidobacteraceae bacterium]|jgi:23S rRNA pseudouridine1911/1915/1917 synthase
MTPEFHTIELEIPPELGGERLDSALARLLPQHSRTRIKAWIEAGAVVIGRRPGKPSEAVDAGARISLRITTPPAVSDRVLPEAIALDLVHQDRECFVVNKPAGLVVHPGAGNREHTMQNALLGLDPGLSALPRAGLIHRLDKDTSGLLVVARTLEAHTSLTRQLMARTVAREYQAVCTGVMTGGGTISEPIGRHRSDRLRMTVREDGRPAVTHYRVLERFRAHTHVGVKLETGRTHQIRLHFSHLRYPIVGDPVYGGRFAIPKGASEDLLLTLRAFKRQALHAASLAFDHPRTAKRMSFESPVPPDFLALILALRRDLHPVDDAA